MDKLAKFSLSLLLQKGIGSSSFKKLLSKFGDIDSLFENKSISDLNLKIIKALSKAKADMNRMDSYIDKYKVSMVFIWQDNYPLLLKEIPDAPAVLFYLGDLESINWDKSISIVGTRKYTDYGKRITTEFTKDIVSAGFATVSGMALGIDSIVHKQTLKDNGRTVAVLASSAHIPTPESNRSLYKSILDSNGVIISETFPHQNVLPGMFAQRNHLIAGLTKATLVTEAPIKSGSLITANLAFEYNRLVYAVPGDIYRESIIGNNNLIKQNIAKLVNISGDLLEDFGLESQKIQRKLPIGLTKEGKSIYDLLSSKPKSIDEMGQESGIDINNLIKICFELEIQGILNKRLDGKYSLS
ncbi:DNA-processing protein DprA [Candidatus Dojkabacteria bacterium]|uniref:DNA-processing protein DprA n=1 Tax=Candidatus Dojkabacteria bacterium TaxID=2099670 RepID=A0A955LA78_9BACT|nr:DNA-processing protein DprA [Candidatus Dojkabacteria bacterium]